MIDRIRIENYRSIESLDFKPTDLCALVGPNSSGKTNILKAIDVLLGESWPTERAFSKDDFFNRDPSKQIKIQVWFKEPLQPCRLTPSDTLGGRRKEECRPLSFMLTHTRNPSVSFQTSFRVIDESGREFWASNEARDQVSFVYVPSERNLSKQMTTSQWTLIGKILKKIDENFRHQATLESEFRRAMEEPKSILESDFGGNLNYKIFKETFIKTSKDFAEGLADNFELDLEIYDPLYYYKTIQVLASDEMGKFNLEELGSGAQNLVLLSLFKTYAILMKDKTILAIEEPETYLYPQAQRSLYGSFQALSGNSQIFYTTHSPNFVSAHRAYEIELVRKTAERGTFILEKAKSYVTPEGAERERHKIYTQFNAERNELFFAKSIIFVEGAADKILIETLAREKWKVDLNQKGISIVECGGKQGVIYFLGICKLMGIDQYIAVWDEDSGDTDTRDDHDLLQAALSSDKGVEIKNNLEHFLTSRNVGFSAQGNKVKAAFEWADKVEPEMIPSELKPIEEFLYNYTDNPSTMF